MNNIHSVFLLISGTFVFLSLLASFYLIYRHQEYMSRPTIQPKIVGILWMVPIYSINSFVSLWNPPFALYLDMLRDCYEAYVLYLFLALMLSYLDADEDEYSIVQYLEKNGPFYHPFPFSFCCPTELPRGKAFLKYCKFGTIQYCLIRPFATLLAIILDSFGLYSESNFSPRYGYLYITLLVNLSVAYAFLTLASFYSSLKLRLKPFEPVGKFLCIKFIIFFAFWQGVVIALLVKLQVIRSIDGYYSAERLSTGLQDFLICFEMLIVAIAHLYTFSYKPFTPGGEYSSFQDGNHIGDGYEFTVPWLTSSEQMAARANKEDRQRKRMEHVSRLPSGSRSSADRKTSVSSSNKVVNFHLLKDLTALHSDEVLPNIEESGFLESVADSNKNKLKNISTQRSSTSKPHVLVEKQAEADVVTGVAQFSIEFKRSVNSSRWRRAGSTVSAASSSVGEVINRHFASSSAVRDFNETMPVVVLPSNFAPTRGIVLHSDPNIRLKDRDREVNDDCL